MKYKKMKYNRLLVGVPYVWEGSEELIEESFQNQQVDIKWMG